MMHPDNYKFIVIMAYAYIITSVVIYSLKLGRAFYYYINFSF